MIVVAGGTGTLGTQVVRRLSARALPVRVVTRDPARARRPLPAGVEVSTSDVRDPSSLGRALAGADTVISAIQGFGGVDAAGPEAIDRDGNLALIAAARAAGARQLILLSILGASPDHPAPLFRAKAAAEAGLRASGLGWTIIRPTAYMELFLGLFGAPLVTTGRTRIFGSGDRPMNFVSAHDVARFVELAAIEPSWHGRVMEVPGPENVSLNELVRAVERETGRTGTVSHVPDLMLRLLATVLRPVRPVIAGQIRQSLILETLDLRVDGPALRAAVPEIEMTTLAEVIRRDLVPMAGSAAAVGVVPPEA